MLKYLVPAEPHGVNPNDMLTMKEDDIDISQHTSKYIDEYKDVEFDYVIYRMRQHEKALPCVSSQSQNFSP